MVSLALLLLVLVIVAILFYTGITVSQQTKQVKITSMPSKFLFVLVVLLLSYCIGLPIITSMKMFRSDSYQKRALYYFFGNTLNEVALNRLSIIFPTISAFLIFAQKPSAACASPCASIDVPSTK